MDFEKDYYGVLGIGADATDEDISSAYRKLMLKWHPDKFASEGKEEQEEANRKSAEINEAYEILSDPKERERYDAVRNGGAGAGGPFGGMGGFGFHGFGFHGFGGIGGSPFQNVWADRKPDRTPHRGFNIMINVSLPFEDFFFGCTKTFEVKVDARCDKCDGGSVGGKPEYAKCSLCRGYGFLVHTGGGMVVKETCPSCGGFGMKMTNLCGTCGGTGVHGTRVQTVILEIPKDTREALSDTFTGVGHAGRYGGENGDITVVARMGTDGLFYPRPDGALGSIHYLNAFKAIGGGYEEIATPYGRKRILVPQETMDGSEMRFEGMGRKGMGGGPDEPLVVTFRVDYPKGLPSSILDRAAKLSEAVEKSGKGFPNVERCRRYAEEYEKRMDG